MSASLLVTERLLSLTTALMNISIEIQQLNGMINKAREENRELSSDDWVELDTKLAQAKKNAIAAGLSNP